MNCVPTKFLNSQMPTAIKIENLSKQYRLGVIGTGTLSHDLNRWWTVNVLRREDPYLKIGETNDRATKGNSDYVWALKDINMEIEQGDVVGIIGKNGAGKSTLLKILSKVTKPTTGIIKYRGRIASLLEVGTGFHAEMTGRENIYMNGSIMGMTRAEITRKLDEIVDFSGCERYLDTPVKRYSSGMTVRLGFAIAAHLDPEILVVDEVLAVGDAEFQKKAIGKMQDVSKGEGRTVLFVSHNMVSIKRLCKRCYVLDNGNIIYTGTVDNAIEYYLKDNEIGSSYYPNNNVVSLVQANFDKGALSIKLAYEANFIIKEPSLGFVVYDNYGNALFGSNPLVECYNDFGTPQKKGTVTATIKGPLLSEGLYYISIWFNDGKSYGKHIFEKERCLSLEITNGQTGVLRNISGYLGPIIPNVSYTFTDY